MNKHPAIRKACLEITLDNGGLNRFRPERQVNKEMDRFLTSRPYDEHLSAIDTWLAGLKEADFETVCCGEETEMETLLALAPPFTSTLLNEYFDEVC